MRGETVWWERLLSKEELDKISNLYEEAKKRQQICMVIRSGKTEMYIS